VAGAAGGDGLRELQHLLAAPTGLAGSGRVGAAAPRPAPAAGAGGPDRLGTGEPGQRERPGKKGARLQSRWGRTRPTGTGRGRSATWSWTVVVCPWYPASPPPTATTPLRSRCASTRCRPSAAPRGSRGAPASGRTSCTRTRRTTSASAAAARRSTRGALRCASPAGGSTPAPSWGDTAGSSRTPSHSASETLSPLTDGALPARIGIEGLLYLLALARNLQAAAPTTQGLGVKEGPSCACHHLSSFPPARRASVQGGTAAQPRSLGAGPAGQSAAAAIPVEPAAGAPVAALQHAPGGRQ